MDKKKVLLVDYQSIAHYMVGDETRELQLQKKALNFIQNQRNGRDTKRKTRRNYSNALLTLGAWLKQHGISVSYVNLPGDQSLYETYCGSADIVFFWTTTPIYPFLKKYVTQIKKQYPHLVTLMGGFHASGIPAATLKELDELDYIVVGEPEQAMLRYCSGMDPKEIPGMAGRCGEGVFINGEPDLLTGDEIPAPDYGLLHGERKNYRYYLQMTRSCPFRCRYCVYGYFWGKVRYRSMDSMRQELTELKEIMGSSFEMHFFDNIISLDMDRVRELSALISSLGMNLTFSADIRAEYLTDARTVIDLERLGVRQLFFGFEDITPECRKAANRTLDEQTLIESLRLVKEHSSISSNGYWMMGLPGTTAESFQKNIQFVTKLIHEELIESVCPDTIFVPLPGTPLFNNAEKYGIYDLEDDWTLYQRSNYFPVFSLPTVTREEVFQGLLEFDRALIQAEADVLKIDPQEAVCQYLSADGGDCVEEFLR